MRYTQFNTSGSRHQGGAALVVGLMLLVVITLLAIGGMNSASVELVMAGNTQYQLRAFETAEMGIEQKTNIGFEPQDEPEEQQDLAVPLASLSGDKFSYRFSADLGGREQPALWGSSFDTFSSYHYQLLSIGKSQRNAQTTHIQGIVEIAPKSGDQSPPPVAPPAGGGGGSLPLALTKSSSPPPPPSP